MAAAIAALQSAIDGLEESSEEEPTEPGNPEDVDKDDTNQDGAVADSDNELPKTATTIFNWLALGFVFISLAFVLFVVSNRRRKQNI
ncbi:LPXTG cell wall anchor domain-containing protein [Paracerasibacillus soli]|uniref:LPXTG cell wall anchor domain-containing protein n=1 Tax=Paracerasibacillus soli TaxID=480284 RepID=A0ABU5CTS4_9BACI|nr:LPXTG cell wall anchor domain-containing protein [Virgibacillus soli]MDY0409244.1 LPXTG cell wall anchor domain-containing protein [Virgibacillus soli]